MKNITINANSKSLKSWYVGSFRTLPKTRKSIFHVLIYTWSKSFRSLLKWPHIFHIYPKSARYAICKTGNIWSSVFWSLDNASKPPSLSRHLVSHIEHTHTHTSSHASIDYFTSVLELATEKWQNRKQRFECRKEDFPSLFPPSWRFPNGKKCSYLAESGLVSENDLG